MASKKNGKWIWGIAASLLLGALGSGLWTLVLGPLFSWGGNRLLSAVTFGLEPLRQSAYQRVGSYNVDRPGLAIYTLVGAFMCAAGLSVAMRMYSLYEDRSTISEEKRRREQAIEGFFSRNRRIWFLIPATSLIIIAQLSISLYVAKARYHLTRSLAVARPHITYEESLRYEAEFVRVDNREAYIAVLGKLEAVVKTHGEQPIEFHPW